MKKLSFLCLLTLVSTWILLIIGGLVNPMGASMACPDWFFFPTCNGEVFPTMTGGVLYEHGHRLAASVVGILTLLLAVSCFVCKKVDGKTRYLALVALFLVILQGILGGVTVLLNLSALVSTLHLICAMVFFSLLVILSFRLSLKDSPKPMFEKSQWALLLAIVITLFQLVFGGVVRHLGAGLACGDDIVACGPVWWPAYFLGQLHMAHRYIGYGLFILVLYSCYKSYKLSCVRDNFLAKNLSILPVIITFIQIGLGLMTIYTIRSAHVVAMHTGFGGLLLASLLAVYLLNLSPSYKTSYLSQNR